ncbi:MAG: hypothetical protein HY865_05050 [Chloroflexi bacterium]|nr:hypothetical protein [Chloroflexota bacterium]
MKKEPSNSTKRNPKDKPIKGLDNSIKPWAMVAKDIKVRKADLESLYQASRFLNKDTRRRIGLTMKIPVFIQDPWVAMQNPTLGVELIEVRLDKSLGDGPTSARIAVVDYNADTQTLLDPIKWFDKQGWFYTPAGEPLPDSPPDPTSGKALPKKYEAEYKDFIQNALKNPFFHQVNVWAIVQRVLEFYEDSQALGRPVPWGFDGNRLLVVPHAGYGENAYYDQSTKSLQFFYFGDEAKPGYTCLSHDIIAHESGHAILDGIRPLYNENSSIETAAFHEFIGDLTAILLALFNSDIRHFVALKTRANLGEDEILSSIAEEFGQDVYARPYLRSASNKLTMEDPDIKESLSAHKISQVLTGAMFDILIGIAWMHMNKNLPLSGEEVSESEAANKSQPRKVTPLQAMWWAADRFRRVALQPLDLCPPCDIQFIDYAKAVIRNDILTNPVDAEGYRTIMLQVFHNRKICKCKYRSGQDLPSDCEFRDAIFQPKQEFTYHDMNRVSRSRTAAYYFLNDNRKALRIPPHQDIIVSDLYDNAKLGALGERLPHHIVLEYIWKEELEFKDQSVRGMKFDWLEGKKVTMHCGGTLVFDDRGNQLSWFHKPGIQLLDPDSEKSLQKQKKQTKLELAQLADMEIGKKRAGTILTQVYEKLRKGKIGLMDEGMAGLPRELLRPVMALEENGVVRFINTPHLRKEDISTEVAEWQNNF